MMNNHLVQGIADGRIGNTAELKAAYHKLLEQTHPDKSGSVKALQDYLELNGQYEEARAYLAQTVKDSAYPIEGGSPNNRLDFYKRLHLTESLEIQNGSKSEEDRESISSAKGHAIGALSEWRPDVVDLYTRADAEYMTIIREEPIGLFMKHSLAVSIHPLIDSIIAYHFSGRREYARQSQLVLNSIMQKLAGRGWRSLYGFIIFLIEDLKNGAAALE